MQQQPKKTTTAITVPAQQQQPVQYVVQVQAPNQHFFPNFPQKQALAAGILLIVAGSLSIIFNIVELAVSSSYDGSTYAVAWVFGNVGHGFWVGVLCIIPGGLGIGASKYKTKCLINAFNGMCIVGALLAVCQFAIALPGAISGSQCYYYHYYSSYYSSFGYYQYGGCYRIWATDVAMEALLTALALVEAAAAIWGSVICCRTTCCCSAECCSAECCRTICCFPCCLAEPRPPATIAQPYDTQLMVIGSNQQMQPVMVRGYQNVAYQPRYLGQPTQFALLTPMYPSQDQFFVAGPPPPHYPATYDSVQYGAQPANEPAFGCQAPECPAPTCGDHSQIIQSQCS